MNLHKKNLYLAFIITLTLTLATPVFFPNFRIFFFSPFLILLFYRKSFIKCLWASLLCGLVFDLLSGHPRLGLHALNFVITTSILYHQRRNFFADSLTTLPIMTFFFSALSTLIQFILLNVFQDPIPLTKQWVIFDLAILPVADAALAFAIYILPFVVFGKPVLKGEDYFVDA